MQYIAILLSFTFKKVEWVFVALKTNARDNYRVMEIACLPKHALDQQAWKKCDTGIILHAGQNPRPMNANALQSIMMWGIYETLTEKQKKAFWDGIRAHLQAPKAEPKVQPQEQPQAEPQVLTFE